MSTLFQDPARRTKLIPRSPRRTARSPTPTSRGPGITDTEPSNESSVANSIKDYASTLTPGPTSEGSANDTALERSDRQPTLEQGVEDLSLSPRNPENFTQSESEAPETQLGRAVKSLVSPVTPSLSVDSADVPLPSVEANEEPAEGHPPFDASKSAASDSDQTSIPKSTEPAIPEIGEADHQPSLASGLAGLSLSSPTPDRSSIAPISEDLLVPLGATRDPVTVRGLLNATPRPSPAPDTSDANEINNDTYSAKFSLGGATQEGAGDYSNNTRDQQEQPGLIVASEDSEGEDSEGEDSEGEDFDFLDDLDRLHLADEYDVRSVEPLPASPFSNPEFQNSLKRGIDLAKAILDCVDSCEIAAKPDTQLNRLRQTACGLSSFDYPAKRRIGIVGDSGAGELYQLFFNCDSTKAYKVKVV